MKTELKAFAGFCAKCKERRDFDGVITTTDSGRAAAMGKCPICDHKMLRILRTNDE